MALPLEGKIAIVTGSSRGIGKAIALDLAKEGADIVVCARSLESTDDLPGSIGDTADAVRALGRKAIAVKMDVFEDDDLRNVVEQTQRQFGRIDILVNNAAYFANAPLLESDVSDLEKGWLANVRAPFLLTKLVAPSMVANGGGIVVNISSGAARHPAPPGEAPVNRPRFQRGPEYGITKAALDRFSTGVAEELAEHNIAVFSVWPGFTLTERMQRRNIPGIDMSSAEPMETTSKAVAFLCKEPMRHTGRIFVAREVCEEHGL